MLCGALLATLTAHFCICPRVQLVVGFLGCTGIGGVDAAKQTTPCEVAARLLLQQGGEAPSQIDGKAKGARSTRAHPGNYYSGYMSHGSHCSDAVQERAGKLVSTADAAAAAAKAAAGPTTSSAAVGVKRAVLPKRAVGEATELV